MKRVLSLPVFAVAIFGVATCSGPTDVRTVYSDAQAWWAAEGPPDYALEVRRVCECLPEESQPARITVEDGVVVSRAYVATGEPVPEAYAWAYPSVEEAFELIYFHLTPQERLTPGHFPDVEADYDPLLGYPTEIRIIYAPNHPDGTEVVLLELGPAG